MPRYAFFRGAFVPIDEARLSIMAHAVNYGTGCFEGIRAYWNAEAAQLFVFRMREHYERLLRSCRILHIALPHNAEELGQITVELLRKEGYREDVYIRPLAYKGSEGIGVRLHDLVDEFAVFSIPFGKYIPKEGGIRACVSSWRRVHDSAIPARAKITGSYVNSALAKTEAYLNGFDEAILLTDDGHVSEGSAENIFLVRNGRLITPSVTENILEGITRATLMELAQEELGIQAEERRIHRTELYIADEAFLCGTGAELTPIVEIDHRPVGTGQVGPITQKLQALYTRVVKAQEPKYLRWCTPVYEGA